MALTNSSIQCAARCAMCTKSGVLLSREHEQDGASSVLVNVLPGSDLLVVQLSLFGLGCASSRVGAFGVAGNDAPVALVHGPTRKLVIPVREVA